MRNPSVHAARPSAHAAGDRPPGGRPPYAAPELRPLGAVGARTAGPDKSPNKHLDQLFGGTGGFADPDQTS